MTTFNTATEIKRLLAQGKLKPESLAAAASIEIEQLKQFLVAYGPTAETPPTSISSLSDKEIVRLSTLTAQLTTGLAIDDDERVRAYVETLSEQFGFVRENIALLIGVSRASIDAFLADADSVDTNTKYRIGVRCGYLISAITQAHAR